MAKFGVSEMNCALASSANSFVFVCQLRGEARKATQNKEGKRATCRNFEFTMRNFKGYSAHYSYQWGSCALNFRIARLSRS